MHTMNMISLIQFPPGPVVNTDPETYYISGPISGDLVGNIPAFFDMEAELLAQGNRVFNPARIGGADSAREAIDMALHHADTRDWIWYMRRSYAGLVLCSAIIMLPGWEKSQGATAEHYVARSLMMPIHELVA